MMTVNQVSQLTGLSVRTLHYYDEIGLLRPDQMTDAGYRLYGDHALMRLQQIMLFRQLKFSLKEIRGIIDSPTFDTGKALDDQVALLLLQKEQLEKQIALALEIKKNGGRTMNFKAFDTSEMDQYAEEAKARWGNTEAYAQAENKVKKYSPKELANVSTQMMNIFSALGKIKDQSPEVDEAQNLIQNLQDTITKWYYTCTDEILAGLGQMYVGDPRFCQSIDDAGGPGTTAFIEKAIAHYCKLAL